MTFRRSLECLRSAPQKTDAIEALADVGDETAVGELLQLAKWHGEESWIRLKAIRAVARIGSRIQKQSVITEIVEELARYVLPQTFRAPLSSLRSDAVALELSGVATRSLLDLGDIVIDPLIRTLAYQDARGAGAAEVLVKMGNSVVHRVASAAHNPAISKSAADVLGRLQGSKLEGG